MLSRTTTLHTLLEEYPFLERFLVARHRVFARLEQPGPRRAWPRVVTVDELATAMDLPWHELLREIQSEVRRVTSVAPPIVDDVHGAAVGPGLADDLRRIMDQLEHGASLQDLGEHIDELTHGLDAEAVAVLARDGARATSSPADLFVRAAGQPSDWPAGRLSLHPEHPVRALQRESARLAALVGHAEEAVEGLGSPPDPRRWAAAGPVVVTLVKRLCEIDRQARRLRLAWYPTLASRGGRSVTVVVDVELGEALAALAALRLATGRDDVAFVAANMPRTGRLVRDALATEEELLVPAALRTLDADDWEAVAEQERVVGWALARDQMR